MFSYEAKNRTENKPQRVQKTSELGLESGGWASERKALAHFRVSSCLHLLDQGNLEPHPHQHCMNDLGS